VQENHDEAIKKYKDELLAMKKQDGNALFEEICEYKEDHRAARAG